MRPCLCGSHACRGAQGCVLHRLREVRGGSRALESTPELPRTMRESKDCACRGMERAVPSSGDAGRFQSSGSCPVLPRPVRSQPFAIQCASHASLGKRDTETGQRSARPRLLREVRCRHCASACVRTTPSSGGAVRTGRHAPACGPRLSREVRCGHGASAPAYGPCLSREVRCGRLVPSDGNQPRRKAERCPPGHRLA
jgi:hypothetical protein